MLYFAHSFVSYTDVKCDELEEEEPLFCIAEPTEPPEVHVLTESVFVYVSLSIKCLNAVDVVLNNPECI